MEQLYFLTGTLIFSAKASINSGREENQEIDHEVEVVEALTVLKDEAYVTAFVVNSKRMITLRQIQAENLTEYRSKIRQLLTIFTDKQKGAYYFENNKLLFQCPLLKQGLFNI